MTRNTSTALVTDDEAVAPVIAVILMVAITVVLAALIGGFVIGVGSQQSTAPQTTLSFEYESGTVTIVHDGGQELDASAVTIEESGSTDDVSVVSGPDTFGAGDEVAEGSFEKGEVIRVVWIDPGSDGTEIVGESTAPG